MMPTVRIAVAICLGGLTLMPAQGAPELVPLARQTQTVTVRMGPPAAVNGVVPPMVLSEPEPELSKEAQKEKLSGIVTVHLVVDEKGRPTDVRVTQGLGHGLDEKAVENVKQYRFKPAMKEGKPVKFEMNVAVNFQRQP